MWLISVLLIIYLIACYPHWRRQLIIKRWRKNLDLNKHLTNHQQLFNGVNGFALSRQARMERDALEYTYGEIDFTSFIGLLSLVKPNINTVFYDLGSGTGKAVLACAMVFKVQKSCGVELFSTLHHVAIKQRQRLWQLPDYQDKANTIHFVNADFLHVDLSEATLIFINATAFFGETWHAVNQHLLQVKIGTIVITTSKKLTLNAFNVIKETTAQMSWGLVTVYMQQRN